MTDIPKRLYPRDSSGRYSKRSQLPTLDALISSFGSTWDAWRTLAQAVSVEFRELKGEATPRDSKTPGDLTDHGVENFPKNFNVELYKKCTQREFLPKGSVREIWCQVGRGGGKTRAAAAALVAGAIQPHPTLAPGERGKAFLLAQNRETAKQAFNYCLGILNSNPKLRALIVNTTKSKIELKNNVDIQVVSASYKHVRGFSIVAACADECAFWWIDSDSANSDAEILNALRPGLARVPNSALWVISSPYAQQGALYQAHRKYFANNDADNILYWKASTKTMNPLFDQREIDRAMEDDPTRAKSEYAVEFRSASETYISAAALDAVIAPNRAVLPPSTSLKYKAYVDPAGGAGADSAALAIAHSEKRGDLEGQHSTAIVLDLIAEIRPPFSPSSALESFVKVLKAYQITSVTGDHWGGDFPREVFTKHGIKYQTSASTKSELYRELLPLITSGRVELLDRPKLRNQLLNLERRASRAGKDSIDHARGAHDDVANAVAGALVYAVAKDTWQHGTPTHRGHIILKAWGGQTQWCGGKDALGNCQERPYSYWAKDEDTYHYSDALWDEISEHARREAESEKEIISADSGIIFTG